jgi:hypothetical protein
MICGVTLFKNIALFLQSTPDDKKGKGEEYNRVLTDIHHIKGKQADMSSVLDQVKM